MNTTCNVEDGLCRNGSDLKKREGKEQGKLAKILTKMLEIKAGIIICL